MEKISSFTDLILEFYFRHIGEYIKKVSLEIFVDDQSYLEASSGHDQQLLVFWATWETIRPVRPVVPGGVVIV